MLSFIKNLGWNFQESEREPFWDRPNNPGRGWYRIYTYHVGTAPVEPPVRYKGESLALVLLDIGAYRDRDLDDGALQEIREILAEFCNLGFDLIIRGCYDTEGKGMVREPSLFSQVKKHVSQMAEIVKDYSDHVYVFQGLLVGSWGEMHESKFLSPKCLSEMLFLFLKATEGKIPVAFRKPMQCRLAVSEEQIRNGTLPGKIGFFNDGMMGSGTHLGTFASETAPKGAWNEPWGASAEIQFMKSFVDAVPYGGEALKPPEQVDPAKMEACLRELRVSYLNSMHDERLLSEWKNLAYGSESFYQHVGNRLGYCLLVDGVEWRTSRRCDCVVHVKNAGYGSLYDEVEAFLWYVVIDDTAEVESLQLMGNGEVTDSQLRWKKLGTLEGSLTGMICEEVRALRLSFERPDEGDDRGYLFGISMQRTKDHRSIDFAQTAMDGKVILGKLKKGRH